MLFINILYINAHFWDNIENKTARNDVLRVSYASLMSLLSKGSNILEFHENCTWDRQALRDRLSRKGCFMSSGIASGNP
jgi:hypothetical protein